ETNHARTGTHRSGSPQYRLRHLRAGHNATESRSARFLLAMGIARRVRSDHAKSALSGAGVISWIEPLAEELARAQAFRGFSLRPARPEDGEFLFTLHRSAMKGYVEATWGWDEAWQRKHFEQTYVPGRQAVIVRRAPLRDVGRISLTRHW